MMHTSTAAPAPTPAARLAVDWLGDVVRLSSEDNCVGAMGGGSADGTNGEKMSMLTSFDSMVTLSARPSSVVEYESRVCIAAAPASLLGMRMVAVTRTLAVLTTMEMSSLASTPSSRAASAVL